MLWNASRGRINPDEQSLPTCGQMKKSLLMTCRIKLPTCGCRTPSFERIGPDETIAFEIGMPSAQEREPRCASYWRPSDCIDKIPVSGFGIADPACAAGMILMRPVSGAAVAFQ